MAKLLLGIPEADTKMVTSYLTAAEVSILFFPMSVYSQALTHIYVGEQKSDVELYIFSCSLYSMLEM